MPLEWLFGHRMTPDEMLRKNQRALNKAMRDLDRENMRMEQQEKKNHYGHQENGQRWTNGICENHG